MAILETVLSPSTVPIEEPQPFTLEEFEILSISYPDLRLEMTKEGELEMMPPAGGESGNKNADLTADLVLWNLSTNQGKVFDSSTGFLLPNGAKRSPDASWITLQKWEELTQAQRVGFLPLCPDFVAELRSPTDRLSSLQSKMREYISCGAKLGWLIDPVSRRVEIYRPHQDVEVLDDPLSVSGEPVLPGFTLSLKSILG